MVVEVLCHAGVKVVIMSCPALAGELFGRSRPRAAELRPSTNLSTTHPRAPFTRRYIPETQPTATAAVSDYADTRQSSSTLVISERYSTNRRFVEAIQQPPPPSPPLRSPPSAQYQHGSLQSTVSPSADDAENCDSSSRNQ